MSQPKPLRVPPDLQPWFEARRRFRLSHATVQMARELGLNPRKFGKLADIEGARWKLPLSEFIADCYEKAYKRSSPEAVRTLEQVIQNRQAKKTQERERKARRLQDLAAVQGGTSGSHADEA